MGGAYGSLRVSCTHARTHGVAGVALGVEHDELLHAVVPEAGAQREDLVSRAGGGVRRVREGLVGEVHAWVRFVGVGGCEYI